MTKIKKVTAATLKKRNAAFKAMKPAQQRVAIAEDVIALIKAETFLAKGANAYEELSDIIEGEPDDDIQTVLNDNIEGISRCRVCAIGAVMVSKIRLGNDCTFEQMGENNDENMLSNLKGIFSNKQLRLMEAAFESIDSNLNEDCHQDNNIWGNLKPRYQRAIEFNKEGVDGNTLLTAIMNNVIKNKGTFKP